MYICRKYVCLRPKTPEDLKLILFSILQRGRGGTKDEMLEQDIILSRLSTFPIETSMKWVKKMMEIAFPMETTTSCLGHAREFD